VFIAMLGEPDQLRAWNVPADALQPGQNRVEFTLRSGTAAAELVFVDLAVNYRGSSSLTG